MAFPDTLRIRRSHRFCSNHSVQHRLPYRSRPKEGKVVESGYSSAVTCDLPCHILEASLAVIDVVLKSVAEHGEKVREWRAFAAIGLFLVYLGVQQVIHQFQSLSLLLSIPYLWIQRCSFSPCGVGYLEMRGFEKMAVRMLPITESESGDQLSCIKKPHTAFFARKIKILQQ